ncbi:MAG: twin-arginine translocation signal domain-containing protein [Actinomycetales bacterium]
MTILDEVRSPALDDLTPAARATAREQRPRSRDGRTGLSTRIVDALGSLLLSRTSRRGFLATTAVTGAALATAPKTFALTPVTAYATVCGDGASCSSGWTAFCCTINAGKNACPEGSLAGGWWKADGSGYCCGNSKYIIDCHYTCSCGCGGGATICPQGCHQGTCTCATGDCDQRRTNCNAFRYGQCNTQIGCVGPVLCRVFTCTPPWRMHNCTTSVATDNRTGNHSASCLPGTGCLPTIDQWWWDYGGPGNVMGPTNPVDPAVITLANGWTKRTFTNGTVYHSSGTGIIQVMNPIDTRYRQTASDGGPLGLPLANAEAGPDGGKIQRFQNGKITWLEPYTDTVVLVGAELRRFDSLGGLNALGYPMRMSQPMAGGLMDEMTECRIYTPPGGPSYPIGGGFLDVYAGNGQATGPLGWPTSSSYAVNRKHFLNTSPVADTTSRAMDFEHGRIVMDAVNGPRVEMTG